MAYSDFSSLKQIEKDLHIERQKVVLFEKLQPVAPSEKLLFDMQEAKQMGLFSEKAKSEFLIVPILREIWRRNPQAMSIFSGFPLDIPQTNLTGYCDFILSKNADNLELTAPIFCIVEAKNRTLEEGFAQCAAEMYAALLFNEQNQTPQPFIYGSVSNGYEWIFLKLQNQMLFIDQERYAIQKLEDLLGVLQTIIDQFDN